MAPPGTVLFTSPFAASAARSGSSLWTPAAAPRSAGLSLGHLTGSPAFTISFHTVANAQQWQANPLLASPGYPAQQFIDSAESAQRLAHLEAMIASCDALLSQAVFHKGNMKVLAQIYNQAIEMMQAIKEFARGGEEAFIASQLFERANKQMTADGNTMRAGDVRRIADEVRLNGQVFMVAGGTFFVAGYTAAGSPDAIAPAPIVVEDVVRDITLTMPNGAGDIRIEFAGGSGAEGSVLAQHTYLIRDADGVYVGQAMVDRNRLGAIEDVGVQLSGGTVNADDLRTALAAHFGVNPTQGVTIDDVRDPASLLRPGNVMSSPGGAEALVSADGGFSAAAPGNIAFAMSMAGGTGAKAELSREARRLLEELPCLEGLDGDVLEMLAHPETPRSIPDDTGLIETLGSHLEQRLNGLSEQHRIRLADLIHRLIAARPSASRTNFILGIAPLLDKLEAGNPALIDAYRAQGGTDLARILNGRSGQTENIQHDNALKEALQGLPFDEQIGFLQTCESPYWRRFLENWILENNRSAGSTIWKIERGQIDILLGSDRAYDVIDAVMNLGVFIQHRIAEAIGMLRTPGPAISTALGKIYLDQDSISEFKSYPAESELEPFDPDDPAHWTFDDAGVSALDFLRSVEESSRPRGN